MPLLCFRLTSFGTLVSQPHWHKPNRRNTVPLTICCHFRVRSGVDPTFEWALPTVVLADMVATGATVAHAVHEHHLHELGTTTQKQAASDMPNSLGKFMTDYMNESKETALEAFHRWREEEASVERACKSMPFTVCLWIVFIGSQLAHRQVEQAYTQNRAMERLLNAQHAQLINETAAALELETNSCGRRLVGAGGSSSGRGNYATGRDASSGLAVESVFSLESPNSVLDWVDETALR
eukprot:2037473-Amphidinium_carterae.1